MDIIICEDNQDCTYILLNLILKWAKSKNIFLTYKCFSTPQELISYLETTHNFDVLFLDIFFDKSYMNGMELAKYLRRTEIKKPIIFVTSDPTQAVDSYLVSALGFLTKPIDENRLFLFMERLLLTKEVKDKYIEIKIAGQEFKVLQKDIVYIEKIYHTVIFHTLNDELKFRCTLNDVVSKLEMKIFLLKSIARLLFLLIKFIALKQLILIRLLF